MEMIEGNSAKQIFFRGKIDRSDWQHHLDSHARFIRQLQLFFKPYNHPELVGRFLGIIRDRCLKIAGAKFDLEALKINCQFNDSFKTEFTVQNANFSTSQVEKLTIADILAFPLTNESLLVTRRL